MKICNAAIPLIALDELPISGNVKIRQEDINFLIVVHEGAIHVIEDRCGHFGISLQDGKVNNEEIRCPAHGARFCLNSGELLNDIFEECDPITLFLWRKKDGWLEVLL